MGANFNGALGGGGAPTYEQWVQQQGQSGNNINSAYQDALANDLPPINQPNFYGTNTNPTMQGTMGGLGQKNLTNMSAQSGTGGAQDYGQLVTNAYQQYLGRAPDAGGLQAWTSALQEGRITPDQLAQNFTGSEEYKKLHPAGSTAGATNKQSGVYTANPWGVYGANATGLQNSTNPYIQAAQQTSLGNLAGAQQATAANRINQQTPYANLQYEQTGTDAQGNPIWTAKQTLAGPLQGALGSLQERVAGQAAQGFNPNTPQVGINPGELYSDAIMRRLQPQLQQQAASVETRLANQGIMPGSEAYNRAKTQLAQAQNDALTAAQVGGINVGLQANQQSFNQQLQQASLPYQQLGAFQQATQPSYVNPYNQAAVSGPDYTGAYTTSQAAQIAAQNAANARTANLQSGLFGLGSSAILGGGGISGLAGLGAGAYNTLFGNNGLSNPFVSSTDYMNNIGATSSGLGTLFGSNSVPINTGINDIIF